MSRLTSKGQVTVPKRIRDALGLTPGSRVDFVIDEQGRVIIRKAEAGSADEPSRPDRFERVRGRATVAWRTDELMRLLRQE